MPEKEQVHHWRFDLRARPASLWPLVSDTDRFNRECGYPSVERLPDPENARPGTRRLKARVFGIVIDWDEHGFEWIEPTGFSVERTYRTGPLARMLLRCDLAPGPEGGTRLDYELRLVPSGLVGRLALPLAAGTRIRAVTERVLRAFDREALAAEGRTAPEGPRMQRRESDKLLPGGRERLDAITRKLIEEERQPGNLVAHLAHFVRTGDDGDASRMQPYALADTWRRARGETLDLFLHATRAGLLDFTWRVLCPHCRGAAEEGGSLSTIRAAAHCASCALDFTARFDESVELTFVPNPAIRSVPSVEFCIGGPGLTPHIAARAWVAPGQSVAIPVSFAPGRYRVRADGTTSFPAFRVEAGAEPTLGIAATAGKLRGEGGSSAGGDAPSAQRAPWEGTVSSAPFAGTAPGFAEPRVAPNGTLTLSLASGEAGAVVVERIAWTDQAATAADVASRQAFRDLFSRELLRAGEQVSVGSSTIVFTDLKDSTLMYRELGDAPAFGRVLSHFDVLRARIAAEGGAIVKNMGDAVMAVFTRPAPAVRALLAAREELARETAGGPGLVLKVSVHAGPCLAINQNERLDYFGTTVNVAARLCALCNGADMILSDTVRRDSEVDALLAALLSAPASRFSVSQQDTRLKGLPGETIRVWRVAPSG